MKENKEKLFCCHCGATNIKLWRRLGEKKFWCLSCLSKMSTNQSIKKVKIGEIYFIDKYLPAIINKKTKKLIDFLELEKNKKTFEEWEKLPE